MRAAGPGNVTAGVKVWFEAARPRTLVAGAVPVLVGTAAAQSFDRARFVAALVVALAVQVGVNYANDVFDALKGIDAPGRVGPRRATAAGLVSPARMITAVAVCLGLAAVAGLYLAAVAGWWLVLVGLACFVAALGYSGGARPYGSAGLGEIFVFLFFGLVATVGSAYVQAEAIVPEAVAAAPPLGMLASAILVANNLRDLDTDRRTGKATLAVRLGYGATRRLFDALTVGPFVFVPLIALLARSAAPALALLAAPLVPRTLALVRAPGPPLRAALGGAARLELVFGALLTAGLWLA